MDIKDYLRIFGRYWWVVLLCGVIGAGSGYAWDLIQTRQYQSTATLFVATQNGASVTDAYQNNLFSQSRVTSYAGLATSEQVAARAVDQLKAPISAEELRSKISATPGDKTVLLNVSVSDPDPATAQSYAVAVSDQLVGLVSELETSRRGGTPAAGLIVVDEADYPYEATGFSLLMKILIGTAAGLLVGLIAAVVVGIFDKRLRGREPVEDVVGGGILGGLPADTARANVDVVDLNGDSLYAEHLRELRTSLRFTVPDGAANAAKVIAVTSPSAQDGRTTTAIDLAAVLAESGKSVVLVDADLRNGEVADRLKIKGSRQSRGLSTVLAGEHGLAEGLIDGVPLAGHPVAVLPSGPRPGRPGELWATDRAESVLTELRNGFDYVVIDTPPLRTYNDGAVVGALSDGAIVLARIKHTTGTNLRRALDALKSASVTVLGTVVTFESSFGQGGRPAAGSGTGAAQANLVAPEKETTTSGSAGGDTEQLATQARAKHGFN